MTTATFGIRYFEAVQGPDGKWWWAKCPDCGEVVKNKDNMGPARHWEQTSHGTIVEDILPGTPEWDASEKALERQRRRHG